ncbi:hypothetical protein [Salibacterium lacus]|uniref:Sigma-70 family RNA polymerase sigma factor n=1 Tax=Salibacterium lacus TaxID=1898109 RepID=A0ABW5T021_9BACI
MGEYLVKSLKDFDEGKEKSIESWVYYKLRRGCLNVLDGKEGTYYERVKPHPNNSNDEEEEENAPLENMVSTNESPEEMFFKKDEADQLQLIDFLCDPAKVDDPLTTAIVREFPNYDSYRSLGKALGIDHKTVKAKLRKLAGNFDSYKFGDYQDYLSA